VSEAERATAEPESCSTGSCLEAQPGTNGTHCPASETIGLNVDLITLKALLTGDALRRLDGTKYRFCPEPTCDIVYFDTGSDSTFRTTDLTVRVGLKEREHPVPLCYCFSYNLADLQQDIAARGTTNIPAIITAEIKAGHCACEVRNPQGTCCLGTIASAIRDVEGR
jgi:hypothetical protein